MMRKLASLLIGIASLILSVSFLDGPLQAAPISVHPPAEDTDTKAQQDSQDSLWSVLAKSFSIPYQLTPQIQAQIDWYCTHPKELELITRRAAPYLYYIYRKVTAYNLPAEIALLPMIESHYDPSVLSAAGAGGLWQLMPRTATALGLRQNWWYDGRHDVIASTKAALDYLAYLQNLFDGNWLLTLAAYNSGEGLVQQAIGKNMQAGLPTSFWSLDLPQQTQIYVPRLLALITIIRNPSKYAVKLPPVKNEPYLEAVDIGSQIELAKAAQLADIDLNTLCSFNPGYKHWATDPHGRHRLLLPIDVIDDFKAKLAQIPKEKRVNWDHYEVQANETLANIAHKFNIKVELIKEINHLKSELVTVGQSLLLPLGTLQHKNDKIHYITAEAKITPSAEQPKQIIHIVKEGETIWTIARRYKVKRAWLCKWNKLSLNTILHPKQQLVIYSQPKLN